MWNNKSVIMKITTSHSMIRPVLKVSFMFYFYNGVCSNNFFECDTFYNPFIVWFCWLSFIPTVNKDLNKINRLQKCIRLGKTLHRFLDFINRKYFTLILKMKILIKCTGKFCYRHGNFQNIAAALQRGVLRRFAKFTGRYLC